MIINKFISDNLSHVIKHVSIRFLHTIYSYKIKRNDRNTRLDSRHTIDNKQEKRTYRHDKQENAARTDSTPGKKTVFTPYIG